MRHQGAPEPSCELDTAVQNPDGGDALPAVKVEGGASTSEEEVGHFASQHSND